MSTMPATVKTMFEQFGGNRAMTMIGLKSASYGNMENISKTMVPHSDEESDYIQIAFKSKAAKVNGTSPNVFIMSYNHARDTYALYFCRSHGINFKTVKSVDDVYADQIKEIFENTTKLYLSF